jgi:Na+-translocating ferredoxin:NAD+ oxidoreductase RnfG subunit
MPTWKIMAVVAILSGALIAAIVHYSSNSLADHTTNSRQQVHQILPAEKPDTSRTPDTEPWGPVRAIDW